MHSQPLGYAVFLQFGLTERAIFLVCRDFTKICLTSESALNHLKYQ